MRAWAAAILLCGCAAEPQLRRPVSAAPSPVSLADAGLATGSLGPPAAGDLGVGILLPAADSTDSEVARVGDVVFRKRDVYDRLVSTHLVLSDNLIQQLEIDALIATQAREHGIAIDPAAVDREVDEEIGRLRAQVDRELGTRMSFDVYLRRQSGLDEAGYRQWLRLNLARKSYRDYVIRYLAVLEDRVEVRFVVHADAALLEDVAKRVREGADFATLAVRHSEDETRREGGLLPPFARGYRHPVAEVASDLQPGELSRVFAATVDGVERHYLVYCVRRIAGRALPFAAVREELDREISDRALTQAEVRAAYDRLRQPAATKAR